MPFTVLYVAREWNNKDKGIKLMKVAFMLANYSTTINNFVDCGFVTPCNKILTYSYIHPHPSSK
jgi:hypothetical protein